MLILINAVLLGAAVVSWGERRLLGRFQNRVGPNRWGPFGALQPIADLAKLITKEDIIPYGADRLAFTAVPVIMVAAVLLGTAVLPFAKDVALVDLNVGVLFVLAVSSSHFHRDIHRRVGVQQPVRAVRRRASRRGAAQL